MSYQPPISNRPDENSLQEVERILTKMSKDVTTVRAIMVFYFVLFAIGALVLIATYSSG